jgi:antitoxin (DNA-binding transcriptional repressor) of toxin-antitoxin stability system
METGIRKLKDNLSRYIRRLEAGERVSVTAHGRVVAELVPPGHGLGTSLDVRQEQEPACFWATLSYDHNRAPANWQG